MCTFSNVASIVRILIEARVQKIHPEKDEKANGKLDSGEHYLI